MNHKVTKLMALLTVIALMLLVVNACSQQTSSTTVVIPDIPVGEQPSINVNEKVNAIQESERLVVTAVGDNLLVNPAFEQGTSGWTSCGGATGYSLTDDSVSGKAGKLSTGCFYQTVDATADTELSLSCKTKIATTTGWSGMGFGYVDSNFAVLEEAPVQTMTGSGFRNYFTTLTAPANTKYASVWVYTDGTVHVDDCSLASGTPSAPQGNLLSNPSFTSSADWFNCGNANSWNIASGNLNLTGTACIYQTNNAQANLQYNLSCTSKRGTGVYASFILSALDQNYQSVGQEIAVIESTSFQAKQISLTTPASTKYVAVTFYGEGATTYQECSLTAGASTTTPTTGETGEQESVIIPSSGNGQWGSVQQWPLIATHIANLKDGRVLAWSSYDVDRFGGRPDANYTQATIFNPADNTFQDVDNPTHDMFCAGLVTLSDGTILAAGGGDGNASRSKVSIFNGNTWERLSNMPNAHWYGTAVVDSDNNVMVSMGASARRTTDYLSNNGIWGNLSNIDLEGTGQAGTPAYSDWYPSLHLSPRGTIFHSGANTPMHEISTTGDGSVISKGSRNQDGVTGESYRMWGNAIMIDDGKIMVTGGTPELDVPSTVSSQNSGVTIDINSENPVVTRIAPMNYSRTFQSTILLPNGEILVLGGNAVGVQFSDDQSRMIPEIYNPDTNTWRDLAAMTIPRNYHSTATLLQDGRVLAAGGGLCGGCAANHQDGEIYSPPYLFNTDGSLANRPVISSTPATLDYNQNFTVNVSGAGSTNITRFSMIKFSAYTHGVNTDLRQDSLKFTNQGNSTYQLTSHSNRNVVTPGYYYLFAVNNSGVPSVAKIVKIGSTSNNPAETAILTEYDAGTATSPVGNGYKRLDTTATPLFNFSGGSPRGIDRGISGLVQNLNRDTIQGPSPSTFNHKLSNGTYTVEVTLGDTYRKDSMSVSAENVPIATNVSTRAGEFKTYSAEVTVNDRELNIELSGVGGTDSWWSITRIVIKNTSVTYRYDAGTATSPIENGYVQLDTTATPLFNFSGGSPRGIDREVVPLFEDLNRDTIQGPSPSTFNHKLNNGTYTVEVTLGDTYKKDIMSVSAENVPIASNVSTGAGEFNTYSAEVTVSDGELNIELSGAGGTDSWWSITQVVIKPVF